MLLEVLYTALCSRLLIVTRCVDADKCRLPQLLFSKHCSNYNVMLHVVLAIALPGPWSLYSFRNVALDGYGSVFRLCCMLRCNIDLASRKELPVAWSSGTRI